VTGAVNILAELRRRGVSVAAEGDTLCLKPRRALDDGLLARIREAKPMILEVVRSRFAQTQLPGATCGWPDCAGCYDLGDGRKIHPPKCGPDYLERGDRPQQG
jgi:hypothetical protein